MKIYVAAKFGRQEEMREVRNRLRHAGHEVTAQWILQRADDGMLPVDRATMDVDDVRRADTLMAFSQERGSLNPGGGRHVEFGIAVERGMRIIVVGPKGEHVFHHLPGIEFYDTLDQAIEAMRNGI